MKYYKISLRVTHHKLDTECSPGSIVTIPLTKSFTGGTTQ